MEAFNEWFKGWHDGRLATVRGTAEDTWRAALEWVEEQRMGACEIGDLASDINDELESD